MSFINFLTKTEFFLRYLYTFKQKGTEREDGYQSNGIV